MPAALKAGIDLVARAQENFKYPESGPSGLLENEKAYVILASGGTKVGSGIDFSDSYLVHVLRFVGVTDVTVLAADQRMNAPESGGYRSRSAQLGRMTHSPALYNTMVGDSHMI